MVGVGQWDGVERSNEEKQGREGRTLQPSEKMARVSTVAVVVPSPAMSFVLEATCRTSAAPMFTKLC